MKGAEGGVRQAASGTVTAGGFMSRNAARAVAPEWATWEAKESEVLMLLDLRRARS